MTKSRFIEDTPKESVKTRSHILADSLQPKDIYQQLDYTVKNMYDTFKVEPYLSTAYQGMVQQIPFIDPLTKSHIAQGDTTLLKELYATPTMHYVNQRLFNYPRSILEKAGYQFPEAEMPGNIIPQTAGVVGALQTFDVGRKIAGKAVPFKLLAGKSTKRSLGRGVVAGATQGALYAPDDVMDMNARLRQAALGGTIGGLISVTSDKISNFIAKHKLRKKTTIKQRTELRRAGKDYAKTVEQIEEDKVLNEATDLVKQNQKEMQDIIAIQQIQNKIPQTKEAFKQWSKNLTSIYETTVDDISASVGKVNKSSAKTYFQEFLNDIASDAELASTQAAKRVTQFVKQLGDEGDIDFKQLNTMRKSILKRRFKGDVDDVVYTRFRHAFSEYAESVDPSGRFAKLNKEMAPQLQFKWKFINKAKVFDKYETKGLETLFAKYASGEKLSLGERELMNDAVRYLGKYGLDDKHIKAAYSQAKVSGRVSQRLDDVVKETRIERKLESAKTKKIRAKQDVKLNSKTRTEMGRLLYQGLQTALRLSIAGYALNMMSRITGSVTGVGGGNDSGDDN